MLVVIGVIVLVAAVIVGNAGRIEKRRTDAPDHVQHGVRRRVHHRPTAEQCFDHAERQTTARVDQIY